MNLTRKYIPVVVSLLIGAYYYLFCTSSTNHRRYQVSSLPTVDPKDLPAETVDGIAFPNSSTRLLVKTRQKFYHSYFLHGGFFTTSLLSRPIIGADGEVLFWQAKTRLRKLFIRRHQVTTSLVYSFSPNVERRFAEMFPSFANDNFFTANSPAIFYDRDHPNGGRLIVVLRIWLNYERYETLKIRRPIDNFIDNYLFTQTFSVPDMQPLDNGHIIGIPTLDASAASHGRSHAAWFGPIEPRLFQAFNRSNIFISYNARSIDASGEHLEFTFIWNYKGDRVFVPKIRGENPMMTSVLKNFAPRDKHWCPFNQPPSFSRNKSLVHFVHSLDPLRILECNATFNCRIAYQVGNFKRNLFVDAKQHLRGGTPFVLYRWPYFISVAHSVFFTKKPKSRYYTANLVVLRADPANANPPYRIVYTSYPIQIKKSLFYSAVLSRYYFLRYSFFFPIGLILENRNSALLGVHVNDKMAMLLRLSGLEKIMDDVINYDTNSAYPAPLNNNADDTDEHQLKKNYKEKRLFKNTNSIGPNRFVRLAAVAAAAGKFKVIEGGD